MKLIATVLLIVGLAGAQAYIDPDTFAMRVYDVGMLTSHAWAQLDEPSSTTAYDCSAYSAHSIQYVVVGDTDVNFSTQGSLDGVAWFTLDSESDAATGTYEYHVVMPLYRIRVTISSEHGTGSTVDATYFGGV